MRLLLVILLSIGLALAPTACTKPTTANIPGAVSNADAQLYVAISDLQTAILAAQDQQAAHPSLKAVLDTNIGPAYQKAKDAYVAYHTALASGAPADASKSAEILQQIQAVQSALTAALKTAGVK